MLRRYIVWLVVFLFPLAAQAGRVMIIETPVGKSGVVEYRADGRTMSFDQLGDTLSKWLLADPGGKNEAHVAVLVSAKTPLPALYNLHGLVTQVGLNSPRFFYAAEGSSKLSEIEISQRPTIMKDELQDELNAGRP